jgi:hypothetical protein
MKRLVGSNQYQQRWGPDLVVPQRPALQGPQAAPDADDWATQARVASTPGAPAPVLARLATSPHWEMRWRVARNPGCPPQVLAALAGDIDPEVRQAVAANPACPPGLLRVLLHDEDGWVRRAAMRAPR